MIARTIDAVYEDGVLKPLDKLDLPEHQRVRVTIDLPAGQPGSAAVAAWLQVYEGLSDDEIADVERIALDRRGFMKPAD
jgi:predicted DNA-binding antitoxin AbrB/MazE fold protein